jgi:hypothetical protein
MQNLGSPEDPVNTTVQAIAEIHAQHLIDMGHATV